MIPAFFETSFSIFGDNESPSDSLGATGAAEDVSFVFARIGRGLFASSWYRTALTSIIDGGPFKSTLVRPGTGRVVQSPE
jgi:hypothetical protein